MRDCSAMCRFAMFCTTVQQFYSLSLVGGIQERNVIIHYLYSAENLQQAWESRAYRAICIDTHSVRLINMYIRIYLTLTNVSMSWERV